MTRDRRRRDSPAPSPRTLPTAALRMLGRRDLTARELTERLIRKGYPPPDVEATVARMATAGTVDDRRTALAHVRTASRIKGRGRLRIQRELEARGLARDLIRQALEALTPDDDLEAIRKFVARKRLPEPPLPADRRRLFQQLLRRGFAPDAIAHALRRRQE